MKRFWVAALAAVAMTGAAEAQQFFRIGTGGTALRPSQKPTYRSRWLAVCASANAGLSFDPISVQ